MKKSLLTTAMLAFGVVFASAQVNPIVSHRQATKLDVASQQKKAVTIQNEKLELTGTASAPTDVTKFKERARQMRKAGSAVEAFYAFPEGILWAGFDDHSEAPNILKEGETSRLVPQYIYVPARKDQLLTNYSSWNEESSIEPTFTWTDGSENEMEQDEEHNGIGHIWGANYVPQLQVTQGKNSDAFYYKSTGSNGTEYRSVWCSYTDELTPLTNAYMPGTFYSGFADCESGQNFRGDETKGKIIGFSQTFEAITGHVWAESAYVALAWEPNDTKKPLEGQELTLTIYTYGDNNDLIPYASATASDDDIVGWAGQDDWLFKLKFTFVEDDPALGVLDSPIVLPKEDFYVTITGFKEITTPLQPTIQYRGDDGLAGNCYYLLDDGTVQTPGYSNYPDIPRADFNIGFDGLYVDAELADPETIIDFPVEGGYGITARQTDENGELQEYADLDIYTNFNHENWYLIDAPEWISGWQYNDDYNEQGYTLFYFTADALPSGVAGRQGTITLECYGKQIDIPVGQGEYEITAISDVKSEQNTGNHIYSLSGQRVSSDYKGLVIKNGKKFFNK